MGQARCRHLVLAEGAGRRGGARHAGAVAARRGAAGDLQARLAAAEDLPPDLGGKLNEGIFRAKPSTRPVMLCVEDALDGLRWAESDRRPAGLIARSEANLAAIATGSRAATGPISWPRIRHTRSNTSICLKIIAPWFTALRGRRRRKRPSGSPRCWRSEGVAYDIAAYRDAPPGLRIWGGATVETADIAALLPWLDWAHVRSDRCAEYARRGSAE